MNNWLLAAIPGALSFVFIFCRMRRRVSNSMLAKFLQNKTILITGASGGLGEALSRRICRITNVNLILASRNQDLLMQLRQDILEKSPVASNISCYKLDLSNSSSIDEFYNRFSSDHPGGVDILINNAGLSVRGDCMSTTMEVHRRLMEVNYFGHIQLTQLLFKDFVQTKSDSDPKTLSTHYIVNISSMQGRLAVPYRSAYSASKHAFNAYFDCLKSELMAENVVNLSILNVSPGYLKTQFSTNALTADGKVHGEKDENQMRGIEPDLAACKILESMVRRDPELLLCDFKTKLALYIRTLFPASYFYIMAKRAKNQQK